MTENQNASAISPKPHKTFNDLVRFHPLSVLVFLVVCTVGTTAAVAQWFANKQEQTHQQAVADLESRLMSVRIGVGNQEDLLLDVTKMQIPKSDLRSIPTTHVSVDYVGAEGNFYVSIPDIEEWRRQSMSEFDLLLQQLPDLEMLPTSQPDPRGEKSLVVWQPATNHLDVSVRARTGDGIRMSLVPFVAVGKLGHGTLTRAVDVALGNFREGRLGELTRSLDALVSILEGESFDDDQATRLESRGTFGLVSDGVLEMFAAALGGDQAALMLQGKLTMGFAAVTNLRGSYELHAVEKKGNVLFMRTITTLETVEDGGGSSTVHIDEEFLFIGLGDHVITIQILVPSTNLQSTAYAWARAWLASLRIPI